MCSRHVHILPRIKAYSILLFPSLPARVRGGNNGEICRTSVSAYTSGPMVAPSMRQFAILFSLFMGICKWDSEIRWNGLHISAASGAADIKPRIWIAGSPARAGHSKQCQP